MIDLPVHSLCGALLNSVDNSRYSVLHHLIRQVNASSLKAFSRHVFLSFVSVFQTSLACPPPIALPHLLHPLVAVKPRVDPDTRQFYQQPAYPQQ